MSETKHHDLFRFMSQMSLEMAAEYDRIRMRASEDPGTAGDQGEENWATMLKGWLPPTYQIVTKGRLIGHDGSTSPQVDVIVLKPSYPPKLLDKKLYLAGGVAAAFECKTTLTAAHIREAVASAVALKSLFPARTGSPYRELRTPIIYGLLAHSHSWKADGSTPVSNIEEHLRASDDRIVSHPRLGLDLLCIADLATWTATAIPYFDPENSPLTCHVGYSKDATDQSIHFTPIGMLIYRLTQKLAWEDPGCRDLADYYRLTGFEGMGQGQSRLWPQTIFSDVTRGRVVRERLSHPASWDEWSGGFF